VGWENLPNPQERQLPETQRPKISSSAKTRGVVQSATLIAHPNKDIKRGVYFPSASWASNAKIRQKTGGGVPPMFLERRRHLGFQQNHQVSEEPLNSCVYRCVRVPFQQKICLQRFYSLNMKAE
jgi:hypothetical protein